MPQEDEHSPPRREWRDPATVIAVIVAIVALTLVCLDGLDNVLFGAEVTFGQWPFILFGVVAIWFFGVRLFRIGGE